MTERSVTPVFDDSYVVCTVSNERGDDEALEFLASLDVRDQTRFEYLLRKLADGHRLKSPEHMCHVHGRDPRGKGAEVHELKSHNNGGLRLYVIRFQARWYVTHGARKGSDRDVPKQVKKAFSIFWDGE